MLYSYFIQFVKIGQGIVTKKTHSGFVLLELLITFCLAAFFALLLGYYQTILLTWRHDAITRLHAIDKARSVLEQVLSNPDLRAKGQSKEGEVDIKWHLRNISIECSPVQNLLVPKQASGYQLLTLDASWPGLNGIMHTARLYGGVWHDE